MKICRFCKKIYSNKYRRCPRCGSFSRSEDVSFLIWLRYNIYYILIILLVFILLFILYILI